MKRKKILKEKKNRHAYLHQKLENRKTGLSDANSLLEEKKLINIENILKSENTEIRESFLCHFVTYIGR